MDSKDLGSKKINNEQQVNEGFSGDNLSKNYNPAKEKLTPEQETDKDGNIKNVERARNVEQNDDNSGTTENPGSGVNTEEAQQKTVENKDRNSDIATNRYPNSHPDNHQNRGNIKLDDE